jgi:hypothetical protein
MSELRPSVVERLNEASYLIENLSKTDVTVKILDESNIEEDLALFPVSGTFVDLIVAFEDQRNELL